MDPKLFEQRLRELAVVKERRPKLISSIKQTAAEQSDVMYQGQMIVINKRSNPSLGVDIELRHQKRLCEFDYLGCEDLPVDQNIEYKYCTWPYPHRRTRCLACGCYINPQGTGFIETITEMNNALAKEARRLLGESHLPSDQLNQAK